MSKKLMKQISLVVLGQFIISCGISLLLVVNLGADPLGVFHTGVANMLGTTFGKAVLVENIIAIIIIYIIDKKYISLATIISMFVVSFTSGTIMNFYTFLLGTDPSMIIRVICLLLSCVILSLGLNVYVLADLGVAGMDALSEMISDKLHFEYQKVKVISDLGFLIAGWIMGGIVGVGTLVSAFLVGPIIQWIRKRIKDPIENFINS